MRFLRRLTAAAVRKPPAIHEQPACCRIGPRLIDALATFLGGRPAPTLVSLYTAQRALLRARLTMAHLLDPTPRTPQKWAPLAQVYVQHALVSLDRLDAASACESG